MSDLISRAEAIAIATQEGAYGYISAQELAEMPSAERTGKWDFIGDQMFQCTHCKVIYTQHQLDNLRNYETDPYLPKYCPNCGARMVSE